MMMDWFGGKHHLIELSIPLFGLGILFVISRVVDTNRSKRYFALGFSCWFGLELLIGLENGSLVSLPSSIGIVASVLLLLGFVGFTGYAILTVLGAGRPLTTTSS
jgi:hypothetical protein